MRAAVVIAGLCAGLAVSMTASPASAAGCGGYVNVWVSGCAPWDNNPRRMPGAPGYAPPRATPPRIATPVFAPPQQRIVQPGVGNRFISDQGGGLISNNRGGLISNNRGGVVSNGGPWR
ncbi:hypothetical protein E8L99_23485 [Phreatobacter aquaticus]|uniref:Uncharacterized protein n=1 Tax=Phreatobacter aquaticus TaxID=2570229 RepID=A0A4D7QL97_9HYPH|nr:hypothetical protein [Phreatobacter aquaticus]QCK88510.1 hypothetical protein E8L99_23485 [Phreatobacter aquaticus]